MNDECLGVFLEDDKCNENVVKIANKFVKAKKALGIPSLAKATRLERGALSCKFRRTATLQPPISPDDYVGNVNAWKRQDFQFSAIPFIEELMTTKNHDDWLDELRS